MAPGHGSGQLLGRGARRALAAGSALARYEARSGLVADECQRAALVKLDALILSMRAYGAELGRWSEQLERWRAEKQRLEREAARAEAARRRQPLFLARALAQRAAAWLRLPRREPAAPPPSNPAAELTAAQRSHPFWRSGLGRAALDELGGARGAESAAADGLPRSPPPPPPPPPPRGLFLHGEVGVGKTLLLDLFFESALGEQVVPSLRRVHYNAFMLEVSSRIHTHSARAACAPADGAADAGGEGAPGGRRWHVLGELVEQLLREPPRARADPTSELIAELARDISSGAVAAVGAGAGAARGAEDAAAAAPGSVPLALEAVGHAVAPGLLCFDELQMMDVADACIVTGVLRRLVASGWVVVATCNRSLDELAASSQHERHPQAAFARVLGGACDTFHLVSQAGDYREQLASGAAASDCPNPFVHPLGSAADAELARAFARLAGGAGEARALPVVFGRRLHVPAQRAGVAWFSFEELCQRPLGAADYVALSEAYHTVLLAGVPVLSADRRDHARRFITLVDCLYNHNSRLICSAEAPLRELFDFGGSDAPVNLEGLEFESESGKSDELGTLIGNTNAPIDSTPAPARVSADNRKALELDATFTGADERFAFRRALSRLLEMQSEPYAQAARARAAQLAAGSAADEGGAGQPPTSRSAER